ncbi:MAG: PEGA domain-containing protein [Candidatus Omnitrophota bacterium]|nr:PEGA domain-containing protein [Candidatus Omnitrophota bacterium]
MKKIIISILIAVFSLSLSGCATIITGWYQKVPVSSDPTGATVQVDGLEQYVTPAKLRLKRNRDHALVFTKDGYTEEAIKLTHVISGAIAGNAVLFGLAGLAIDNLSGSQFKLIPTKVHVELKKSAE